MKKPRGGGVRQRNIDEAQIERMNLRSRIAAGPS
jgi:hypothetical protein